MRAFTTSIVHEDPAVAGREVALELREHLGGQPDLVLLFATMTYEPAALLGALRDNLAADVKVAGCSSCGEINSEEGLSGSVTAMGLRLDRVEVELFKVDALGEDQVAAGRELGRELAAFKPDLLMLFPDGVRSNPPHIIRGIQEVTGDGYPIIGGAAGEPVHEQLRTLQYIGDQALSGGLVAVALRGPLALSTATGTGFQAIGKQRVCTKVEDEKIILEIDGKPAIDVYTELLGEEILDNPIAGVIYPLAVSTRRASTYGESEQQRVVIRVVQEFDRERGALKCGGDVSEGTIVRVARAAKEDLIAGAVAAIDEALERLPAPALALFFNCAGRKIILGPRYYKDEIAAVYRRLGAELPKVGFYTYGEVAPIDGRVRYHNETFTVALLGEA